MTEPAEPTTTEPTTADATTGDRTTADAPSAESATAESPTADSPTADSPTADSPTRAMRAIEAAGIPHRIVRTERASSADESARFQGIERQQLLRTIVVRRGEDDYLFVLVPAGRRFEWPKLRELLGVRRMTLPDAEEARAVTGYERYTITPFGSTRRWPVIVDTSIVDEPVVAIGGGGFGINIHVAPADLVAALDGLVADVSVPEAPHEHEGPHGHD